MNTSTILKNLKSISDASGQDFLELSTNFPILVGELNNIKREDGQVTDNANIARFENIKKDLNAILKKQEKKIEQNKEIAVNFRNRNIELVNSFSSRMEVLKSMNTLIQKIKDESSEMELISLNAMVVSIKSGKEGQAFSYITSNLKQLSLRLIAQSDALIANEQSITENIEILQAAIEDVERISDKTTHASTGDNSDIAQVLDSILTSLNKMFEHAAEVRQPILKAMECIQMQDIIRQSLDDVILTVSKIQDSSKSNDNDDIDDQLDQACFDLQLTDISIRLLENINNKLIASIEVFKANRDRINFILSAVEDMRQKFIKTSLQDSSKSTSLQGCINKTSDEFSKFIASFKSYQTAQEQVLDKSNIIQNSVQRIQLCFSDFFPIINNLTYVAIAQRIEVARNANINSIKSTVEYMSDLITQTDHNVQEAQDLLQDFIDNSTKQIKNFSVEAEADRKIFAAINKSKTDFLNSLGKLKKNFITMVENFKVYSDDFFSAYHAIQDSIENLEVLSTRLESEHKALSNIHEQTMEKKSSLMQQKGVSEWTIRNDLFNNFIHQFTVVSDKLTAGNITGIDIEEGVEAGEITFF